MTERPFAAFDIDGTVVRWQLYHALADELARQGLLDTKDFERAHEARMTWKRRTNEHSFEAYEAALVNALGRAWANIRVEDFEKACHTVIDEYKDQVYTYTRDLIRELKAKNYLLFAISASQSQIVGMFAEYYGFDDFGGSEYEVNNGQFTGKIRLLKRDEKPAYLKILAAKHNATWQGSIAVGDSESDIPMLSIVEQPIAFNPTKALFSHAERAGWKVVVERKNMVYELEPRDGSYLLAQTDG